MYFCTQLTASLPMNPLQIIRTPIENELSRFEALFATALSHDNPVLTVALQHVRRRKGKMMRPILVLLAARGWGSGPLRPEVYHAAVALEILHTASLVHDDVVDESDRRRGQQSVNALLDNKAAVLVGDFMLSTALHHAAQTGSLEVVNLVAELGRTLADGELLQLAAIDSDRLDEATYFDVIRKKTASLFATCAHVGALLGGADAGACEQARRYGEYVGVCFQLRDDVFDYFPSSEVGKPTGNDMREGKLTLPLIHALTAQGTEREIDAALKVRRGEASADEMAALVQFAKEHGGIAYAEACMDDYRSRAVEILAAGVEPEAACALQHYVDFVVGRSL